MHVWVYVWIWICEGWIDDHGGYCEEVHKSTFLNIGHKTRKNNKFYKTQPNDGGAAVVPAAPAMNQKNKKQDWNITMKPD